MAQTLPLDVYHLLEDRIGREQADKVASAIEIGFDLIEKKADAVALQKKLELRDELTDELATKADLHLTETTLRADLRMTEATLRGEIQQAKSDLRTEIQQLRTEVQTFKVDLEGRMSGLEVKMETLRTNLEGKMETLRIDLEGKMESSRVGLEAKINGLNQKLNFMIILMLLALTLMNPIAADLIKNALR